MECTEQDCSGRPVARGLCGRHYKAWQRADKPDGHELSQRSRPECIVAECDRVSYARGHCERHYRQLLRAGQVQPDPAPLGCAVDSCDRKAVTRGWCHGHYLRWSRKGDVLADVPLSRPVHDACTVEGCQRGATTQLFCRSHYNRFRLYGDPLLGGPVRITTGQGSLSHGYWMRQVRLDERHLVPEGREKELEHRLVMAAVLGRPLLPHEVVHHIDGNRLNNRPENLQLWSTAQPKGQRVEDKLEFARQILALYAERPDHSG